MTPAREGVYLRLLLLLCLEGALGEADSERVYPYMTERQERATLLMLAAAARHVWPDSHYAGAEPVSVALQYLSDE